MNQVMKSNNILAVLLTCLSITACSTTPTHPNAPVVLEQHKNISAEPTTEHNLARLIKQSDNCVIEFTGNFQTGKATEHWIFKGDQLISAFSNIKAEVKNQQTVFDIQNTEKQSNFAALKKNFKQSNLDKCM